MSNKEMFERSFQRPTNYFELSASRQWEIDKDLGILDWDGSGMSADEPARFRAHYGLQPI